MERSNLIPFIVLIVLSMAAAPAGQNASRQKLADAKRQVFVARNELEAAVGEAMKFDTAMRQRRAKLKAELRKTANDDLRTARAAYDASARPALAKVRSSQEYKDAVGQKQKAQQTAISLRGLRAHREQDLQDAVAAVQALESKALVEVPKIGEAKAALTEAQRVADALDERVEAALQRDDGWLEAKERFETANQKVAACRAALSDAISRESMARRAAREPQRRDENNRPAGVR